ncbi:MAG TPA: hypothetical protein PL125_06570 [Candidatus Omnitrophota bacterium]|nr:hypothetical protein [Candidatus Omnitrophota bacterium]HPT39838.1 hypothetical protein [Candidatus Omnitrophota bacterium]
MKKLILFLIVFICGCSSIPFKHLSYVSFEEVDPQALRNDFLNKLPVEFELLNSTIFKYRHFNFSSLGITRVDTLNGNLNVAGFNHLGVKLFDLSLIDKKINCQYALPEFTRRGDFTTAAINDIKKIYFDRIPSPSAKVKKEKYRVIFKEQLEEGRLEYVFSGEGNFLAEKNYYLKNRKIWSIFYYNYIFNNGKVFPEGILLKHYQYGYQLIVRLKEIRY